jgi:hypothetical protein
MPDFIFPSSPAGYPVLQPQCSISYRAADSVLRIARYCAAKGLVGGVGCNFQAPCNFLISYHST